MTFIAKWNWESYNQRTIEIQRELEEMQKKREEWESTSTIDELKNDVIEAPKDNITRSVMEDLKSRADRGLKKYGTTLHQNNKDDYMNHLYEELLDAAQYIKKEQSFVPNIQKIIKNTPNDQELGTKIREIYGQK